MIYQTTIERELQELGSLTGGQFVHELEHVKRSVRALADAGRVRLLDRVGARLHAVTVKARLGERVTWEDVNGI
jgi:hypothetical protein